MAERSPVAAVLAPAITVGPGRPLAFILGPCVIESAEHTLRMAAALRELTGELGVPFVFKTSFDKANRSSLRSYRGPGLAAGLEILAEVKRALGIPVLTDVHEPEQAAAAAEVADVLQVPAFLCRQTDLLLAAGRAGKPVNIKKGQFLAPDDVRHPIDKVRSTGNPHVTITERGASFGYHNLVVDLRAIPIMRAWAPVVFDATHSLQLPGAAGDSTGGAREFHLELARGAVAAGVDVVFAEVHDRPAGALSDPTTQLSLDQARTLIGHCLAVRRAVEAVAGC